MGGAAPGLNQPLRDVFENQSEDGKGGPNLDSLVPSRFSFWALHVAGPAHGFPGT